MFTSGQLVGLYVFTLFVVYCILSKIMDVVRFNKECELWIKYYEVVKRTGKSGMLPKLGDTKNIIIEKEKEDERNDSGRSEENSEA